MPEMKKVFHFDSPPDQYVADAAVLCPSFYEVKAIANPGWWTRFIGRLRRRVIASLAPA